MSQSAKKEVVQDLSYQLERNSWALAFFAMLTECGDFAFPSYNLALGFWGAFCAFGKHGRATFGLILFTFLSIIIDIVFLSKHKSDESSMYTFTLTMFIFCLLLKALLLVISSKFFAAIGGANSMESSHMSTSLYDSLHESQNEADGAGGYFSPHDERKNPMTFSAMEGTGISV